MKKAVSAATSAALLASLLATAVAPAALASTTVTSAGSVARGQTSTTTASFLFTENDIFDLKRAGNFDVYIWDNSGDCAVAPGVGVNVAASTVHFVGPATISAPGSLDASVTLADHSFNVKVTAQDPAHVETILIGGLKIKADVGAATGAIKACVYNDNSFAVGPPVGTTGIFAEAFADATATATGKLAQAYGVGTTTWDVAVDSTSACDFAGIKNVTVGGETRTPTGAPTLKNLAGQQTFTTNAFAVNHLANDVVTQTVSVPGAGTSCIATKLGSPGSVADSLKYNAPEGQYRLNPGETNQGAVYDLSAQERTRGFLAKDATITLTIATAGVTFSKAPNADVSDASDDTTGTTLLTLTGATGTGTLNVFGVLAADYKSVTWTVATKSGVVGPPLTGELALITFDDIFYDVASTVAAGTAVDVTLATSAGLVQPTSRSNAVVGRVLNVTATSPVVYIGENNQTAGKISIVEVGPGFFQAGTGANNTLAVCIIFNGFTNEQFATAPWAKVTAGDLRLREGDVASTDNVVQGKPIAVLSFTFDCYYWTVWTASTTTSTVVLSGDEAGTAGVKINVPAGSSLGPVTASVRTGDLTLGGVLNTQLEARAVIAVRQFRNQVVVTALSQPTIPVGSNGSAVGDIQIQETANGQLKGPQPGFTGGERICVEIVPNQNAGRLYDAFLKGLNTADVPIVTASNGILTSGVTMSTSPCAGPLSGSSNGFVTAAAPLPPTLVQSFSFYVTQQSTSGNGKLVISNIKYATVNDAVEGPVQVNVYGFGLSNTLIDFQALISNAKIGVAPTLAIAAYSALGLKPAAGYTTKTPKYAAIGQYVTWKFTGGPALAGQRVNVLVATKVGGIWGFPKYLKSAWADANGVVTFAWKSNAAAWVNVRVQWPSSAAYSVTYSKSLAAVVR